MGKDREGNFHPKKGKPSGSGKDEGIGLHPTNSDALEQYIEVAEKYTEGADEMPANVRVRHPNRNVNKGQDRTENKNQNNPSDKERNETFEEQRTPVRPEELPTSLTKELFAELAAYKSSCCISVLIPTHQAGVEVNEQVDLIAFKNVLQNLTASLTNKGKNQTQIQTMLEPGFNLLREEKFWYNLSPGLALFMAEGYFKYVRLPYAPTEETLINTSFFLKPLVPLMTTNEHFYLLSISKKRPKFFRGDIFGLQYLPIDELPTGVDDVVHFEEKEDENLFRTGSSGAGGGANYHGVGAGKPDEKKHVALYLEEVDDTLWKEVLHKENVPLVLAGVEYLIPIYKSVTDYKNIWSESLTGNHEHDDLHHLYEQVRPLIEPYFKERQKKALLSYGNQSATALTSSILADIIPAAYYGQVSTLFVRMDEHIWGTFDEMNNKLSVHDTQQEGDECLIDKAVIKTILNDGDVYFLSREEMPVDSPIAVLLRYAS